MVDGVRVRDWPETEELSQDRRQGGLSQGDGLLGTALKGLAAGLVATWVLDRVDWAMWDAEDSRTRAETRRVRPGGLDPAHVAANRIAGALGRELNPTQPHPLGIALHYSFATLPTVAYALMRHQVPAVAMGGGTLFGLAAMIVEDEGMNPLLGLAAPPQDYPWQDHARSLVAHVVVGVVAEGLLRVLDGPAGEPKQLLAA